MTTRQKQRAETRARLITAGAKVFAQQGVQGARIADIAREAGVAMGTLYTHFDDKDSLFEEVIRAGKTVILDGLRQAQSAMGTRAERDRLAMAGVVMFSEIYSGLFRLLMGRGGATTELQAEVMEEIIALRVHELESGKEEGWLSSDLDPELAARGEVGLVFHLIDWWLSTECVLPREELIDTLSRLRRFGVEGAPA